MTHLVFIPLTDELLYDHPELISGPVVPYVAGTPCYHWLSVELNPLHPTPAIGARLEAAGPHAHFCNGPARNNPFSLSPSSSSPLGLVPRSRRARYLFFLP